jgi:hypothetical protein
LTPELGYNAAKRYSQHLFAEAHVRLTSRRALAVGEPYRSGFEPSELGSFLKPLGYELVEDLDQARQTDRFFRNRADGICPVQYWHWAHTRLV